MKNFNILTNQQRICGRIIPANAIYGALTLKYTRKVPLEKYRVTDKNGHLVFNADGTEKYAYKTRRENCAEQIVYSIETTKLYRDDKGVSHFIVQLGRKNKNGDIVWREHVLGDCALTRELEKFLTVKIISSGLWSDWDKYEIAEVKLSERRAIYNSAPKRRDVQKDYVFKGRFGYYVNPNVINENVKARTPLVHTNMDKLKGDAPQHERYASPYSWEYGKAPKRSGNIEEVANHDAYMLEAHGIKNDTYGNYSYHE